ncbi:hypothetical protein [Streptacidiphilus anmyonensis]|uniref:hypothetical protein n=1 Tax=Streptacidiphilus anmyonensis TaxID=405782 RepID=UPI0005A6C208|nr:hypothetical protein [Streptacidiphilus anmyonensis]
MSRHIVRLDFWGVGVRVDLPTAVDQEHFSFQFRNHLVEEPAEGPDQQSAQDLTVVFRSDGDVPWCRAVLDPGIRKDIWIKTGGGEAQLYDSWLRGSSRPSPLPPLGFPPLAGEFRAVHAACALPADGGPGIVVTGESGAGKSSILLYLLESGHLYGGDDLVPVSRSGIRPYLRTMNIRTATLRSLPAGLQERIREHGRPMETPSGVTYLVQPADLGYPSAAAEVVTEVHRVHLTAADAFSAEVQADGRLAIGWDAPRHRAEAMSAVGQYVRSAKPFRFAPDGISAKAAVAA